MNFWKIQPICEIMIYASFNVYMEDFAKVQYWISIKGRDGHRLEELAGYFR